MTRFGFVLDQRSCIGCHACTVACKQEHGVELGVFRTWVKYIEQGTFPALVDMTETGDTVHFRRIHGVQPWASEDPSSERVWWSDAGVHQNITFPVHPDPISGMHCWHQKVRVRPADPEDRYADIHVDFAKARAVYRKWLALTRPASGELRRPIWLFRPVKPVLDAYQLPQDDRTHHARSTPPAHPDARDFADAVDWNPAEVWGPLHHPADSAP